MTDYYDEKVSANDVLNKIELLNFHKDMQAYLDKSHRQQNNEILIRHSPGIGECFFVFKYSINRKNKKIFLRGAVKMPLSVSY